MSDTPFGPEVSAFGLSSRARRGISSELVSSRERGVAPAGAEGWFGASTVPGSGRGTRLWGESGSSASWFGEGSSSFGDGDRAAELGSASVAAPGAAPGGDSDASSSFVSVPLGEGATPLRDCCARAGLARRIRASAPARADSVVHLIEKGRIFSGPERDVDVQASANVAVGRARDGAGGSRPGGLSKALPHLHRGARSFIAEGRFRRVLELRGRPSQGNAPDHISVIERKFLGTRQSSRNQPKSRENLHGVGSVLRRSLWCFLGALGHERRGEDQWHGR